MEYLDEEWMIPELQGTDKASILKELSSVLVKPCQVTSVEELLQVLAGSGEIGLHGNWRGDRHPPWPIEKVKKIFHLFWPLLKGRGF